ncbi:MAG: hypothetical protein PVJ67_04155 [Candidatus Pacearchaeota archaeon]|jgi:hypothetical protein
MKLYQLREFIENAVMRDIEESDFRIGGVINDKIDKRIRPVLTKILQRLAKLEKLANADDYEYKRETKLVKKK